MIKKELLAKVKSLYPYYKNIAVLNKKSLEMILNKNCNDIKISNESNSCYLDSLLVALFNDNNEMIQKMFLETKLKDTDAKLIKIAEEIRQEMISIYDIIQKGNKKFYCKNLRRLFHNYYIHKRTITKMEKKDWIKDQLEPLDVLNLLQEMFEIKSKTKYSLKTYGANNKKDKKIVRDDTITDNNFISNIEMEQMKNEKLMLKTIYPKYTDNVLFDPTNLWKPTSNVSYKYKITIKKYLAGDFLFIYVNRKTINYTTGDNIKLDTKIIPEIKMKLKDNKFNIYLRSMIIHHGGAEGGHYTTIYECKGLWYEYDDMKSNTKRLIGTFEDVCKMNKSYNLKNLTNLVYY